MAEEMWSNKIEFSSSQCALARDKAKVIVDNFDAIIKDLDNYVKEISYFNEQCDKVGFLPNMTINSYNPSDLNLKNPGSFMASAPLVYANVKNTISTIETEKGRLESLKKIFNNTYYEGFKKLQSVIDEFDDKKDSLVKEVKKLDKEFKKKGFSSEKINGVKVIVYTDPTTGKKYSVSEMVNAVYTYQGMTIGGAYEKYIAAGGKNMSDSEVEALLSKHVNETGAYVDELSKKHFMGVSSKEGIDKMYKDAVEASGKTAEGYKSEFKKLIKQTSLKSVDNVAKEIGSKTNSRITAMAVAGGLIGTAAYSLIPNKGIERPEYPDTIPSPDGGTGGRNGNNPIGNGGSSGTGGNSSKSPNKDKSKEKNKDKKSKAKVGMELVNPELEKEMDNKLPQSIDTEVEEKDYDDLAREQFESQDYEAIAENRASKVEEANQLFDSEDKNALKQQLSEYGYSDSDIETIIQDRDLTVNAIVDGDQRAQLSTIAKDLASKDGVTDFNSSYDEDVNSSRLTNGESEKLLSNLTSNSEYRDAKGDYNNAKEEYVNSVEETNKALSDLNDSTKTLNDTKKSVINSLKKKENWSNSMQDAYSNDVQTLKNSYVKKYGKVSTWTAKETAAYNDAKTNLKQQYVTKVQGDSQYWNSAQVEKYNKAVDNYNNLVENANQSYQKTTDLKVRFDEASSNVSNVKSSILNGISVPETQVNVNTDNVNSNNINTTSNITDDQLLSEVKINESSASING